MPYLLFVVTVRVVTRLLPIYRPSVMFVLGLSYTIPDSYRSDINLRCFPVLSAITTFYI